VRARALKEQPLDVWHAFLDHIELELAQACLEEGKKLKSQFGISEAVAQADLFLVTQCSQERKTLFFFFFFAGIGVIGVI